LDTFEEPLTNYNKTAIETGTIRIHTMDDMYMNNGYEALKMTTEDVSLNTWRKRQQQEK